MSNKELLEEIVGQIREGLPKGVNLEAWIDDADRFDILDRMKDTAAQSLAYQWGRLLGAAEWADQTVLELLDWYDIDISEPSEPRSAMSASYITIPMSLCCQAPLRHCEADCGMLHCDECSMIHTTTGAVLAPSPPRN